MPDFNIPLTSRVIYEKSKHLQSNVKWILIDDVEWIYGGTTDDLKLNIIINHFDNHFKGFKKFNISLNRNNSYEVSRNDIEATIIKLIGIENFFIWDSDFKNVIEFNEIGVFRKGEI